MVQNYDVIHYTIGIPIGRRTNATQSEQKRGCQNPQHRKPGESRKAGFFGGKYNQENFYQD